MTEIFEKLAELRKRYPEDIARIEADSARISALLKRQDYQQHEVTQAMIAMCRTDIVMARKKLATERNLTETQRAELWAIVDARQWYLSIATRDFSEEMNNVEAELDAELSA